MKIQPHFPVPNWQFISTVADRTWRKSRKSIWVAFMAGSFACRLSAEPFSDNLETLDHVSNDSGNCVITQGSKGRMVVARNSDRSNEFPATFGWNIKKASRENGFSLDPAEEQFVLEIKGIAPVTNGKAQAKLFVVPFFGKGAESLGPLKGGDRGYWIPVEPDENGTWRCDMREIASRYFSEEERPAWWFTEVIIDSEGDADTGYAFSSISAVGKKNRVIP